MTKFSKSARDNRANQLNHTHPVYYQARGEAPEEAKRKADLCKSTLDNRANQLNPKNSAYWTSREEAHKPLKPSGSSTVKSQ